MKYAIKKNLLTTLLCAIFPVISIHAAVPSLINYQGRLTDASGDPVTGDKTLAVAIYDAASGGNLLYSESIGVTALDERGIYSFQFGAAGTSIVTKSETVGTTDGTLTVYNKVLTETALTNTVSITDGTYTWSQTSGSSSPSDFLGSFDSGSGTVSAIYISGAPAAGRTVTVTYSCEVEGISGALAGGAEHWLQLSVNGIVQSTRDRVLAVPFALRSGVSNTSLQADDLAVQQVLWRPTMFDSNITLPIRITTSSSGASRYANIPVRFSKISQIKLDCYLPYSGSFGYSSEVELVILRSKEYVNEVLYTFSKTSSATVNGRITETLPVNIELDPSFIHKVKLTYETDTGTAYIYDCVMTVDE
ncbi:MAG: hypothetical protein KJO21_05235 [Verrucomicrobiae bacterium]|nr:hypothetical protein [Verrucomicrobiae bacterium]NNJ43127.1 hypothetical protein [Akkermansiaceae bacterium]